MVARAGLPSRERPKNRIMGGGLGQIRGTPIVHEPIGDVVPALMPGIGSDASASKAAADRSKCVGGRNWPMQLAFRAGRVDRYLTIPL